MVLEVQCCFVTFSSKLATYLRNKKLTELKNNLPSEPVSYQMEIINFHCFAVD